MAGREIFAKRHQLRAFSMIPSEPIALPNYDPDAPKYKVTSEYQVTSEFATLPPGRMDGAYIPSAGPKTMSSDTDSSSNPKSYSVNISARPSLPRNQMSQQRKHKATMEANRAAFGYAKVALLFFVSLLVTWVPSSINRVYSLIHPESVSVQYAYAAGIVLSLMGFWNSVIYIATSHRACKILFSGILGRKDDTVIANDFGDGRGGLGTRRARRRGSFGDSLEGLAGRESV